MKRIGMLIIILLSTITIVTYTPMVVSADSGWDNDYSSSSSSSSSSYDHDSSSSGGNSKTSKVDIIFIVTLVSMISIYGIYLLITEGIKPKKKTNSISSNRIMKKTYNISKIDIKKYFPDKTEDTLAKELYDKFVSVQEAWMNFDYNKLQELCTSELYESYKSDLEILKKENGKNIMSDFKYGSSKIVEISESNNILTVKMLLNVSFYDYVINTETNKVIKGFKDRKYYNDYELDFICTKTNINKCPNCGATINSGDKECNYCHNIIDNNYKDFVLSKKTKI